MRPFPAKATQWNLLLLILFITAINYLDRSAVSFAILPLEKAFSINNQDFGFIASAFGIGYLMMCFFSGILVDRFGPFKVWAICAFLWSLSTFLMSQAQGFWSLFLLRLVLGFAEAVHFPALLSAITHWLAPHWRARCIAIGLLGVPIASLIGAPFLSYLIEAFSWQIMFIVLGILGFIWVFFWSLFFWKQIKPFDIPPHPDKKKQLSYRQMLSSRIFLGNCLNFFIFGYSVFFALMWLPGYIEQTFQVNILKTGGLLIFPWASSTFFILLGGWVSDALWRKTRSLRIARIWTIGVGMILSGLSFFAIKFSDTLEYDILYLSLGLGFAFFANAPMYSLNADLFKENTGKAQGVMTGFFALAGIFAPALTGWLVTSTGNFDAAIFLIAILSLLSSVVIFCLQRIPEEQKSGTS